MLTQRSHGCFRAQRKQTHPYDQERRANQKTAPDMKGHRDHGKREKQNDYGDG